jgi:predicted PurR-regulated permease PerM
MSFVVLVLASSILLALFYKVVSAFLLPLFLAVVAVLLLRPLQVRATAWCGNRRYLAALLMTAGVLLAVLVPVTTVTVIAGSEALRLVNELDDDALRARLDRLRTSLDLRFPVVEECRFIESSLQRLLSDADPDASAAGDPAALERIAGEVRNLLDRLPDVMPHTPVPDPAGLLQALATANSTHPGTLAYRQALESAVDAFADYKTALAGGDWRLTLKELAYPKRADVEELSSRLFSLTTDRIAGISSAMMMLAGRMAFSLMIFVMALFFWFADGPEIVRALMVLSPLEDKYEEQLLGEFEQLVRAVVAGSIASAATQAVLAGIGFTLVGMESVFLLMATTAVLAMVPFVGASLVWMPVSVWLVFAEGRTTAGVGLAMYGLLIISTVDNVIRPWIIVEKASLHPLAGLVGVLGGLQALGPTGVFVGPIVVAFLQTVLTLLHREFASEPGPNVPADKAMSNSLPEDGGAARA